MNIYKLALPIAACIAAASLSACTPSSPVQSQPSSAVAAPSVSAPQPPATKIPTPTPPPKAYDEWEYWSTGVTVPELTSAEPLLGLTGIEVPQKSYFDLGYVGVAKLEKYCMVALMDGKGTPPNETVTVVIMSRYDSTLDEARIHMLATDVKRYVDSFRPRCAQDPATSTV